MKDGDGENAKAAEAKRIPVGFCGLKLAWPAANRGQKG
jgi:hypothetical protein